MNKSFLKLEEGRKAAAPMSHIAARQNVSPASPGRHVHYVEHTVESLHLCAFSFSLSASCVCTVTLRRAKTCTWSTTLKFGT